MKILSFSSPFARLLVAGLFLAIGSVAPSAQEATGVEIYEFGIYQRGEVLGEFAPANKGYRHTAVSGMKHLQTTRIIPGRLGVSFGVRYRVQGGIGFMVPVRVVLKFPPQGLLNPEFPEPLFVDETEMMRTLGGDDFSAHTFDYPWEIEPGIWTFEFWSGDRKLGEEQFEVITPPIS
nr:MAG: DUF3859 domain-containing protein [Hyphomicrobiales bacterium]